MLLLAGWVCFSRCRPLLHDKLFVFPILYILVFGRWRRGKTHDWRLNTDNDNSIRAADLNTDPNSELPICFSAAIGPFGDRSVLAEALLVAQPGSPCSGTLMVLWQ